MYLRKQPDGEYRIILREAEIVRLIGDLAKLLSGAVETGVYGTMHGEFGYENLNTATRFAKDIDKED